MAASSDGDVYSAATAAGLNPDEILDFSGNANPCPLPESLRRAIHESVHCLEYYPDPKARKLRQRASEVFGVSPDEVRVGNGVGEFLYALPRALRPRRVVVLAPCPTDYWRAGDYAGAESEGVLAAEPQEFVPDPAQLEMRLSGADMVFLGNPNDPTGVAIPAETIRVLARKFPRAVFAVDESFMQFVPHSMAASLVGAPRPANVVVFRSPTPLYGLPGLRLGFMIASRELADSVDGAREPWTVGSMALCAGEALLGGEQDVAARREPTVAERERIREELSRMAGLRVFRSQANFLLLKTTRPGLASTQLCERLLKQKVLIRNVAGFRGLDAKFARVSMRSAPDNDRLLAAFRNALDESQWK